MGNTMSIYDQIKARLDSLIPKKNEDPNHERKRRADSLEEVNVLPKRSRHFNQILEDNAEYSDVEMDTGDLNKRKSEMRKSFQKTHRTFLLNGTNQTPQTYILTNKALAPNNSQMYIVDASFGKPLANSSARQSLDLAVSPQSRIKQTPRDPPPNLPLLLPISRSKAVPSMQPISNGFSHFNGLGETGTFLSRGHQMVNMAAKQKSSSSATTSILEKQNRDSDRQHYLNLLRQIAPTIYKSGEDSISEKKSVETQTTNVSKASSYNSCRAEKSEETLSVLLAKLNCRSAYTTKPDTIRARFEVERRERERKIQEEEEILAERRRLKDEKFSVLGRRVLDVKISYEDIISKVAAEEEEEVEEVSVYPELTKSHLEQIKRALNGGSSSEIIVSKFNLNITRADLQTLVGMTWLNDEVINFYMNLIIQRSSDQPGILPRAYCMNTFFVPTLMSRGHSGVRRWTRKVDIFGYDIIPVPVHVGKIHWCMAVIRVKEKIIRYYDSMGNSNQPVLDALEQYLVDEMRDKKQQELDTSDWVKQNVMDCPQQSNGSDCGVFSCMFAEHLTRNASLTFGQSEMPYFRHKMIYEIATGQLMM